MGYRPVPIFLWLLLGFPIGAFGAAAVAGLVAWLRGEDSIAAITTNRNGLTLLGSLAACLAFSVAYIRIVFRESPWRLLDAVAFSFPLSVGFGRIGCFFNGCCYGRIAERSDHGIRHAFSIPVTSIDRTTRAGEHVASLAANARIWNLPLLLLLGCVATLVVAEFVYRRREAWSLPAGTVVAAMFTSDAAFRFAAEFSREESVTRLAPLHPWQLIVAAEFVFASVALGLLLSRARINARGQRSAT